MQVVFCFQVRAATTGRGRRVMHFRISPVMRIHWEKYCRMRSLTRGSASFRLRQPDDGSLLDAFKHRGRWARLLSCVYKRLSLKLKCILDLLFLRPSKIQMAMPPPFAPSSRGGNDPDSAVRATDNDAAIARLSAVQKQYLVDPFVRHLVPRAHLQPPRPPLINIGTYVRTTAIDDLVYRWLSISQEANQNCQIVSLGAGSDTRFWRISSGPFKDNLSTYVELDFPEITTKKAMTIKKSRDLSSVLGAPEDVKIALGGTALYAPKYYLLPTDLRRPPLESLGALTQDRRPGEPLLSPHLPTLLLFECVLVYMSPSHSAGLIEWFLSYFQSSNSPLGAIVYEMFGLNDSFGRVMVNNLKARNVSLPGADPYPTKESLPLRFSTHGFELSRALTLYDIRKNYIDQKELNRISALEMLDELEELDLVLKHYAITWGVKCSSNSPTALQWGTWGLKPSSRTEEEE